MSETSYPGKELRARREALGLTPYDVFVESRIPTAYVVALEEADFDALPAVCYAVGFLRTYCAYLGLNPERFADSYRTAARRVQRPPQNPFLRKRVRPTWKEDLVAWTAICAILLLSWLTYSAVVGPKAEVDVNRVDAGSRLEILLPPTPSDPDF